ncbi:hypothetical protein J3E72DRAFT_389826 [Bipolaris maydis]|nr:hypothetical protein BM1_00041 [Bipolaris maydis]KAJ6192028.1 hypothetical protein J3E72DRAFT_389826 [Bipolaris maydis]KAJ6284255.1 hypothetical protein J3E71DRAFT_351572 [Bipolaris maydis]
MRRKEVKSSGIRCGNLEATGQFPLPSQTRAPPSSLDAPEPYQKLIWVTFPDEKALEETTSLAIQVFFDDHKTLRHDRWLTKARNMTLNNTVISESNAGHYIHQGLVTLLATEAQAKKAFSVEGYTWDWLEQQLPGELLYSSCTDENNEPLRSVLFLHWTTNEPINPSLDEIYSEGIRGRIGKVIAIAKTAFEPSTQALAVRRFDTEDLHPPLQRCHLVEFALFVFEALRARPDSMLIFESLEVGVRLDIGLAYIDTVNKFFVNEITRWYGAHYFSHHILGEPKTQICKEFASAFSAFLNGSTSHIP